MPSAGQDIPGTQEALCPYPGQVEPSPAVVQHSQHRELDVLPSGDTLPLAGHLTEGNSLQGLLLQLP